MLTLNTVAMFSPRSNNIEYTAGDFYSNMLWYMFYLWITWWVEHK